MTKRKKGYQTGRRISWIRKKRKNFLITHLTLEKAGDDEDRADFRDSKKIEAKGLREGGMCRGAGAAIKGTKFKVFF